jgi:putative SOS response-associated peptidase YedK
MLKKRPMCYDISYTVNVKELADYFPDLEFHSQLELDFDAGVHIMGHSYAEHTIIYRTAEGQLLCRAMEWGCIPFSVKDEKTFLRQRATMLNARSERILEDTKSYWHKIKTAAA